MTDEILNDIKNQTELKIVADEYVKRTEIFLCKFSDKFYIIIIFKFLDLSEIVFFLHDITAHMNFIIDLIFLNVNDFSTSDHKQFVNILIEKNSSFFLQ